MRTAFRDPALAVPCNVARELSVARGVADVNCALEIKRFHQLGNVVSVGIHVVAICSLCGTAVSAPIVSDAPVTVPPGRTSSGCPSRRQRGASRDGRRAADRFPILVVNLSTVLGFNSRLKSFSLLCNFLVSEFLKTEGAFR